MSHTYLVTGASGQFGKLALEALLERGVAPASIIATTRSPDALTDFAARGVTVRAADFDAPASLEAAFRGATRALLISTDAVGRPGARLAQHANAITALGAAGVRHVVYTSLTNPHVGSPIALAPDHNGTEALLAAAPFGWTILRNNLYSDLSLLSLPAAIASGQLYDARGDGAVGFVTRADTARAAAGALLSELPDAVRTTLEITGPELLTSKDVAAIVSDLTGKTITHIDIPPAALIQGMVQHGLPQAVAELMASFDVAIARDELGIVSSAVTRLTGRPPESLRSFLARSLS